MTASRALAAQRGISEEVCKKIDQLHEDIDAYIARAIKENISECLVEVYLKDMEFLLQELWDFQRMIATILTLRSINLESSGLTRSIGVTLRGKSLRFLSM